MHKIDPSCRSKQIFSVRFENAACVDGTEVKMDIG